MTSTQEPDTISNVVKRGGKKSTFLSNFASKQSQCRFETYYIRMASRAGT